MSLLLLDAGNSRIKWRLVDAGEDLAEGAEDYAGLGGAGPSAWREMAPSRVAVSLVQMGEARAAIERYCAEYWGLAPEFSTTPAAGSGVVNGYDHPAQLGVDRWLALVAARAHCRESAVVVDAGTAVTADWLDGDGWFRGGMIAPGRRVLESVFARRVPQLVSCTDTAAPFPATNTGDAVALGIQSAVVASLDRFIDNAASAGAVGPRILLTGGDAGWLQSLWPRPVSVHSNLVLDGLGIQMEHSA